MLYYTKRNCGLYFLNGKGYTITEYRKRKGKQEKPMNIRTLAAIWAAKFAGFACKKLGRQGVTWAGKIALRISPHILKELSSQAVSYTHLTLPTIA